MMLNVEYPPLFKPTGEVLFSCDKPVSVPQCVVKFKEWSGEAPKNTFGNKQVLDHNGKMAFAELCILWTFKEAGWEGGWVSNRNIRVGYWSDPKYAELSPHVEKLCSRINGGKIMPFTGCWDVVCWKDDQILFVESKRAKGRDRIHDSQIQWLQKSISLGLKPENFLLVEWDI